MHVPPPCGKNCPNRTLGCHSACAPYKKWEERRRKIKSALNKEKDMLGRNFNGR